MKTISTIGIAALLLVPACAEVGGTEEIGRLTWAGDPVPTTASGDLACPSPMPSLDVASMLCEPGACDEQVMRALDADTAWAAVGPMLFVDRTTTPRDWNACDHLPETGPCALACDFRALVEHWIPEGACVTFVCPLDDGGQLIVGGCN